MSNTFATVDISGIDLITEKIGKYGPAATEVIQEDLKTEGFERISTHIPDLINASGRSWRGKPTSATQAAPTSVFKAQVEGLTLTVSTQKRYNYLYFPDDGSNSKHHAGNQDFMFRGAESMSDEIANDIVKHLITTFEEV